MEKKKNWLIDILVKVGVAQADSILDEKLALKPSTDVAVEDVKKTHSQLSKWVDVSENKVS